MGRGDIKTRKGKTFAGSFGNRRPHKDDKNKRGAAVRRVRAGSTKNAPAQPKT